MESNTLLCDRCMHREVCSLKRLYTEAQETIERINIVVTPTTEVVSNSKDPVKPGQMNIYHLEDLDWIRPVILQCKYYEIDNQMIAR